jgi:hypothetical protein
MHLLAALAAGPRSFRGEGVNHENEAFAGSLKVQPLEGGRAVLLSYVATLRSGEVAHSESTLLSTGQDGNLCLWPVMSELPAVVPHVALPPQDTAPGELVVVFASGPREQREAFREEITIQLQTQGGLLYAHAWGLPGGAFEARSSCLMAPSEA